MNILLLEDDVALNRAITKVAKLDHHSITTYYNGQDVADDLDFKFDLYILDINVPNVSGLELLHMIMLKNSFAKVIIISSNTDIESLQKAYEFGCMDYIKKPFHLEELRLKIKKIDNDIPDFEINEQLTKKEHDLLYLLISNRGEIVTYSMIEATVYENKYMTMDGLRAMVKRLRSKLENDMIENIVDQGYKIANV